ncbi:LON peptidase N-terminal domain and RING finger protein 2 isoform X1 [Lepisosteus oculatus]|uniref:LON peptidase N-terminal domain and RING finger protein 2 isoform X1 n=1 Tax=Lepisosteus oculatus TaxID=7918 RepID=UPI0035F52E30
METSSRHCSEQLIHDLSNPAAAGLCPEMLEVAEEAWRAGDFNLAAEIYASQLAGLPQPDRGLCLRKGDALGRAGRISEALDSYCTAARLGRLRAEELRLLVESIAQTLRDKELSGLERKKSEAADRPGAKPGGDGSPQGGGGDPAEEEGPPDLFSCRLCKRLLSEPTTLQCGHTFCKPCLEDGAVTECLVCAYKLDKRHGQLFPLGFKVNVILGGLLDKWFAAESRARRLWLEGDSLWQTRDLETALEKYDRAAELAPFDYMLLGQRAELHMEMKNYNQAIQDGDSTCRLRPLWPKAHFLKAAALAKAGRTEEALQEYFFCVALRPDWSSAKLEAQKILSELFSSVFENSSLPAPLSACPKPSVLGSPGAPTAGDGPRPGSSQDPVLKVARNPPGESGAPSGVGPVKLPQSLSKLEFPCEDRKTLTPVLSSLPGPVLKRKSPSDLASYGPPSKLLRQGGDCLPQKPTAPNGRREVPTQLVDSSDMECSLCMRLFYEPVTTPCGHTFCLRCMERCLDHNPNCPLCKENLSEYLAARAYNKTCLMEEVLVRFLSEELAERKKVHEEELRELSNLNKEVPIFVCTMAFPTIPCPLHVFEPRYRLMIRRSMETGTRQFGMCIADELKGFADYGCMLEVRDVKFFPDGRSVVDTIGVSRFKVLSHGQRDGYNTAKIEYLEDKKAEGEEYVELVRIHDSVYDQAVAWFTSLRDNMKNQILSHFGSMPGKESDPQASPSGPAWCWWLLAVLPLENRAQLTILAMTSLKDRLNAIRRVLIFVTRKRAR